MIIIKSEFIEKNYLRLSTNVDNLRIKIFKNCNNSIDLFIECIIIEL